jgi:adenosylcobinamide-phosphate guanylyltransferase
MGVTALVMAGGKGTRIKTEEEKPLLKVNSKPLIEYILDALKGAKKVNEIVVAVSQHTPKTATFAKRFSVKVLRTPGKDWCSDVQYAIRKLQLGAVLTIASDLPLITGEVIEEVIEYYERCCKPALTVAVPLETCKRLGLSADYIFEFQGKSVVPTGIDVIDGKRIDEGMLEEEILVVDDERIAVNINTLEDLKIAESMLQHSPR